jgi:hypothetical protein
VGLSPLTSWRGRVGAYTARLTGPAWPAPWRTGRRQTGQTQIGQSGAPERQSNEVKLAEATIVPLPEEASASADDFTTRDVPA